MKDLRRWADGGERCNICTQPAKWSGLCEACHRIARDGEVPSTAPKWYHEQEINQAIARGTFLNHNESLPAGIARHLQLAFEKGFSLGLRQGADVETGKLDLQVREMGRLLEVTNLYHCGETCGPSEEDHNDDCLLAQEHIKRQAKKQECQHGGVFRGEKCAACGEEVR